MSLSVRDLGFGNGFGDVASIFDSVRRSLRYRVLSREKSMGWMIVLCCACDLLVRCQ